MEHRSLHRLHFRKVYFINIHKFAHLFLSRDFVLKPLSYFTFSYDNRTYLLSIWVNITSLIQTTFVEISLFNKIQEPSVLRYKWEQVGTTTDLHNETPVMLTLILLLVRDKVNKMIPV